MEEVGRKARLVSWADVVARGRKAPVETEVVGAVSVEPELRSKEMRTGKIGSEAMAPEAIVVLQEVEGILIENWTR